MKSNSVLDLKDIMKDSKQIIKSENRQVKKISNKPLLKQRVAQLYVSGLYTNKHIASILNITEPALKRLLKQPDVLDLIIGYQSEEKELIDTRIKALRNRALDKVDELLESEDDSIVLQTVKDILDRSGHAVKKDNNVSVTISYEQQLAQLAEGLVIDVEEIEEVPNGN